MNKHLKRLIIMIVGVLLILIISEAALRVLFSISKNNQRDNEFDTFIQYSPLYGWENKANISTSFKIPDTISNVSINSMGFRDYEHNITKEKGKYRIIFVGDSINFGYGVNNDETYSKLLETYNKKIETINMAVSGYGTDQEYLTIMNKGLKMNPDMVILTYTTSIDLGENNNKVIYGKNKPLYEIINGSLILTNVPVPESNITTKVEETSFIKSLLIYKNFRDKVISMPLIRDFLIDYLHIGRYYDFKERYNLTFKLLSTINQELEAKNIKFLVIIFPDKSQVSGIISDRSIFYIADYLKENNISYINLYNNFSKEKLNDTYFKIDGHFNINGNKQVANLIYSKINKEIQN
ncbi:MAG: hypothetical protein PHF86_07075 [Candidatus Nanoarchaeia archaeon]|nr:hypothetical protein [Candidatus Nanoarchaeia archaeon]